MDKDQIRLLEELLFTGEKKPSVAKMLFFGVVDSSRTFPFPTPSAFEIKEVDDFVEKLDHFATTHIDADQIDRQASIPDEVIQGLGELGVLGMTIPQEYGGLGMSQYAYCRSIEKLAQHCGSTALFVNAHQSIGLKSLLLFGSPDQKKQYLPPLAKGEQIAAFSLTEPNAGSDASSIETSATFDPTKNIYRINGKKQWTTNGSIASLLTVMAKVEGKVTAFLVTPDMPGFKIQDAALEKVGTKGTKTANLTFNNLEVPKENILGHIGGGLRVCLTALDYGRVTFGANCTGIAKFLVEKAIEHAKHRIQFKRPLASFSLVKKKLALMAAYAYAMDATTYLTAGLLDRGEDDVMLESAILKVFASESLWNILYDTMQIFGGRSFFTDYPFERIMRDSRLNMIGEGSNDVLQAFIAVVGARDVGVQLKGVFDELKIRKFTQPKKFAQSLWYRLKAPQLNVGWEKLKPEATLVAKAIRSFGFTVLRQLAKNKEGIIEKQLVLERLALMATSLYTSLAVLAKLDKSREDYCIAKLYIHHALRTFHQNSNLLSSSEDALLEYVSDQLTGLS